MSKNKYEYKHKCEGFFKGLDPDDVGNELERIESSRGLTAETLVNESRPESAVMHPCFEWKDDVAAENYRKHQARTLIGSVVQVEVLEHKPKTPVRSYHNIGGVYRNIEAIFETPVYVEEMIDKARRDLRCLETKYSTLSELPDILIASAEHIISERAICEDGELKNVSQGV